MPVPHQWHVFASRAELAQSLAKTIADKLSAGITRRGTGFVAVSGGSTPALLFAELSKAAIEWKNVIVTLIDERLVPPTSPRSNARLVADKLLQGPAAAANFVPLYHGTDDPEAAATLARSALGKLPWPLDVAVLGMGSDGHTASFFPDAPNLADLLAADADKAGAAGRGGECRRAQADADARQDRRGRFAGAPHRGRRRSGRCSSERSAARNCRSVQRSRLRRGRWRSSGPNRPVFEGRSQALVCACGWKSLPLFPLRAGKDDR